MSSTSIAYSKRSEDLWEKALSFAKNYAELRDLKFYAFQVYSKLQKAGVERTIILVEFITIEDETPHTVIEFFGINDGFMGKKDLLTKVRPISTKGRMGQIVQNGYTRRPMVEIEMMAALNEKQPMKVGALPYVDRSLSEI